MARYLPPAATTVSAKKDATLPAPIRPHITLRIALAASVVVGVGLVVVGGFVTWLRVDAGDLAGLTVSGWGLIGGTSDLAGSNINDLLADVSGSYRQAVLPVIFAGLAAIAAIRLGWGPSKIGAATLVACGLCVAGWGLYRGLNPGNLVNILDSGESRAGVGPWLVFAGGVEMIAVGAGLLAGVAKAPAAPHFRRARGISPR
ncbi:hypothetical protein EH165_05945 [Nakamurella antarctica]|uniref:Uncharacterized protein n=1 Tax=Nakamurella antarctica TaxID=1902245 RepID=A0A3G8ZKQ3_9ACTN|nr:hypothetical protein [Nakamurella antarctica]AZI57758.1 hypothetical protein EH165_05945 [Nakamurella antarctica]